MPLALRLALPALLLLAVVWAVLLFDMSRYASSHRLEEQRRIEAITSVGAVAVQSVFRTADLLLMDLREHWQIEKRGFHQIVRLRQTHQDVGIAFDLTVVDIGGRLRFQTRNGIRTGVGLDDGVAWQRLKESVRDEIQVSPPQRPSQGNAWALAIHRPVFDATTGQLDGMITLSLSLDHLSRIFVPVNLGEDASVAVFRDDGALLVRTVVTNSPESPGLAMYDQMPADNRDAVRLLGFLQQVPEQGVMTLASAVDGIARNYARKAVGNYPVSLVIGRPTMAVDAQIYQYRIRYLLSGLAVSGLLLAALYWLFRTQQEQARAFAEQSSHLEILRRSQAELSASQQRLRDLSSHQMALKEAERKRIAQEVHDELGQRLTVLRMDLAMLPRLVSADPSRLLPLQVSALKASVDETLAVVRDLAGKLRPATLDIGLREAIEGLIDEFQSSLGIPCVLESRLSGRFHVDETRTTAAFRIVQEALTNVARHAKASRVSVLIESDPVRLRLMIADDGRGFDPARGAAASFGLSGMRERAAAFSGTLDIRSASGSGTTIEALIPIDTCLPIASRIPDAPDSLQTVFQ